MSFRSRFWQSIPGGPRFAHGISRRLARLFPRFFADRLENPIFVLGFSSGGKTTMTHALRQQGVFCIYPDEGNHELWFPGHFPWREVDLEVPPIWYDPPRFISAVVESRDDDFLTARGCLGAYQWIMGGKNIVIDSGMLAALFPELLPIFPDAKIIHLRRDGRVVSYLTARMEWSAMMRGPAKYKKRGCELGFQDVLTRMSRYWRWTIDRVQTVGEKRPGDVLEVTYEDWCENPDGVLSLMMEFLGEGASFHAPEWRDEITNMNDWVISDFSPEDLVSLSSASPSSSHGAEPG